ncbi:hypothetical protein BDY24DRAFT_381486 [Mrakia frigida]|uniref:uncharacterized protein n=1 Tax=Mrakia frigida TaxID=29902 RepID=UPI003FCBF847
MGRGRFAGLSLLYIHGSSLFSSPPPPSLLPPSLLLSLVSHHLTFLSSRFPHSFFEPPLSRQIHHLPSLQLRRQTPARPPLLLHSKSRNRLLLCPAPSSQTQRRSYQLAKHLGRSRPTGETGRGTGGQERGHHGGHLLGRGGVEDRARGKPERAEYFAEGGEACEGVEVEGRGVAGVGL